MILKASRGGTMPITLSMGKGKGRVNGKAKSGFLKNASYFIVFTKAVYSLSGFVDIIFTAQQELCRRSQ